MKHIVTNFGRDRLEVFLVGEMLPLSIGPGASFTGEIDRIIHNVGRTHYSVRPAERGKIDDEEESDG